MHKIPDCFGYCIEHQIKWGKNTGRGKQTFWCGTYLKFNEVNLICMNLFFPSPLLLLSAWNKNMMAGFQPTSWERKWYIVSEQSSNNESGFLWLWIHFTSFRASTRALLRLFFLFFPRLNSILKLVCTTWQIVYILLHMYLKINAFFSAIYIKMP